MRQIWEQISLLDIVVSVIVIVVAVIGGISVIVEPDRLAFKDYVEVLGNLMIGVGLYGIGKGVVTGARTVSSRRGK